MSTVINKELLTSFCSEASLAHYVFPEPVCPDDLLRDGNTCSLPPIAFC